MNNQITAPNKRTYMTFHVNVEIIPKKGNKQEIKKKMN